MSLIHLNSNGQDPHNFTNVFPQGITLGKHTEVCLVGYSGMLKGDKAGDVRVDDAVFIVDDNHSKMTFQWGRILGGGAGEQQTGPFVVNLLDWIDLQDGQQQMSIAELGDALEDALELSDPMRCMYSWRVANGGAPGWLYSITARKIQQAVPPVFPPVPTWAIYGPSPGAPYGATPTAVAMPAVGPSLGSAIRLNPDTTGANQFAYACLTPGFVGDDGTALGAVGTPTTGTLNGWCVRWGATATTTFADMNFFFGLTKSKYLTLCQTQKQSGTYDPLTYNPYESDLTSPSPQPNPGVDWCFPKSDKCPAIIFGLCVRASDGAIGVIQGGENKYMRKGGGPSDAAGLNGGSLNIDYDTPAANVAAGVGDFGLCICPRWNAGIRAFVFEIMFDNNAGTGAEVILGSPGGQGWVIGSPVFNEQQEALGTPVPDWGNNQLYWGDGSVHSVCYFPHSTASSVPVFVSQWENAPSDFTAPIPDVPLNVCYEPAPPASTEAFINNIVETSQTGADQLATQMGFVDTPRYNVVAMNTTGLVTDQNPMNVKTDSRSPFLICCPDLPIRGYVGAGTGGGAESQLLGVGRIRNLITGNAFSNEVTRSWLSLGNEYDTRLDRLRIELRDEQHKPYTGLLPDFSCWLQFRCPKKRPNYGRQTDLEVGATAYN